MLKKLLELEPFFRVKRNQGLNCSAFLTVYFELFQEPVQCEDDIVRFCQETGLPIALDETIDKIQGNVPDSLARFTHPGIVALVGSLHLIFTELKLFC